ncbi:MAG: hypothetical protein EB078_11855 [Proteobacteria bacterium]|nr:hypothetical protein [Pseudomonadota bacterium]NDC25817.1 hypothetical protein [Pseudomonadota bacterium]NDD05593.1 hypothetical protein [Pseudomonadota bacterium]NDG25594.1 hypothetical protein [Pseudomonadota bacterium]
MRFLILVAGLFALTSVAQPYKINCKATKQQIGTHWLVNASLKGTLERGRSVVTLQNFSGGLAIYHDEDFSEPWAKSYINQKSLENDEYYHPVKYKNHYRFELDFEKTENFEAERVQFLLPKAFESNRGTRAYFILNRVNGTFGGTVQLTCQITAE